MANTNTPTGLNPVRYLSGAPYNGAVNVFSVPSSDGTAFGIGDPVKLVGTSLTINGQVIPSVALAATTDVMVGVVVAFVPDTRDSLTYRAASTQRLIFVADDPNLLFEVQEGTGGTPLTANDIGLNISFAAGTLSTYSGRSGLTIDNATEATTNTLALKIVGLVNRADNEIGDSAKYLVRLNRHQYVNQIAGI